MVTTETVTEVMEAMVLATATATKAHLHHNLMIHEEDHHHLGT
jgi:hypothetical protein